MRFLRNISDEIIKINDSCIEFSFKHKQFLKSLEQKDRAEIIVDPIDDLDESTSEKNELDEKLISEIEILRSKIKNHSDYLVAQLDAFPYGNPVNFFYYSLFGSYIWNKTQIEADQLLTVYQDTFLKDTILQSESDLSEPLIESIVGIDKKRIDTIVVSGIDLINFLEDHSKKIF
ncbi:hypothetical protein ABE366_01935 [Acinetobacter pittii]|jgi:hypothetical protein|uniref:hypothetical protein n=1 Tax=Acinetobacter pittii TaxID=48296 RepID=UPI003209BC5C